MILRLVYRPDVTFALVWALNMKYQSNPSVVGVLPRQQINVITGNILRKFSRQGFIRLGSVTLSQLAFLGESVVNFHAKFSIPSERVF